MNPNLWYVIPEWLNVVAVASLAVGATCALLLLFAVLRRPQEMAIMNWVWPITGLYLGPIAVWMYLKLGRPSATPRPFFARVAVGVSHCGAGCVLGDIVAEFAIFYTGFLLFNSMLTTQYIGDYTLAYIFGIAFQYFSLAPMRKDGFRATLRAAIKADTLSLTAFEIGLFGWMAISYYFFFHGMVRPDQPIYWFMMQIGMVLGFLTSYPANWVLIRTGVKEVM